MGLSPKAQVRDGDAAGLFGVVLEVRLNVLIGVVADDLDGVLVCADGSVAAKTPELAGDRSGGCGVGHGVLGKGVTCNVVNDADGEALPCGVIGGKVLVNGKDGGGGGVLGAETVTAADDLDVTLCPQQRAATTSR